MSLTFETPSDDYGLEILDAAERHHYALETDAPVTPESVSTDRIDAPVDAATAIVTDGLDLPNVVSVYVRDTDREIIAEAEHFADIDLPPGQYTVELSTPIKTYLHIDAALQITADMDRTHITFDGDTDVVVGARSRNDQPEATITTTDDPADMMAAVSALSSALKEPTPERSYPTMRGHPPLIELGDRLDIPDSLDVPDTGVTIEIPAKRDAIYVAAPLAYYLGAELVPGDEPRIVAGDTTFSLDSALGFEREVERALKQVFFLDCCVRTEGLYPVDLNERGDVEALVDFDMGEVYDGSVADQVTAYLEESFEELEPHMPEWKLTTHVSPGADSVEVLPFVLDDLAIVRLPETQEATGTSAEAEAIEEFVRDGGFTRSTESASGPSVSMVQPDQVDSLEQAWVGDGAPVGASKPTVEAFQNRLQRRPADDDIDITVVCNDPQMEEEWDIVGEVYAERDRVPFDVTVHRDLTVAELRSVVAESADFLHYIGHIDDEGFECADGKLDASTLEEVGVQAFFLNACQSYDQGMALIEAGSVGGVVTLREVVNSGAVTVGSTLSRLLNRGFSLRTGLEIARDESIMGHQYMVVGDGGINVAQTESGAALLCELERVDAESWELEIEAYPTTYRGMGSLIMPLLDQVDSHYLCSGTVDTYELETGELLEFLSLENMPVVYEQEVRWSEELRADLLT